MSGISVLFCRKVARSHMKECNLRFKTSAELKFETFCLKFSAGNMKGRLVFPTMILLNVMVFCQEEITFGTLSKADFGKATLIC